MASVITVLVGIYSKVKLVRGLDIVFLAWLVQRVPNFHPSFHEWIDKRAGTALSGIVGRNNYLQHLERLIISKTL